MTFDWNILRDKLTGNSAVATYLFTIVVSFFTWLFTTVQTTEQLKAEQKYRFTNDSLRISIMELVIDCGTKQ